MPAGASSAAGIHLHRAHDDDGFTWDRPGPGTSDLALSVLAVFELQDAMALVDPQPPAADGAADKVHALVNFIDLRVNGASLKELQELFGGRRVEFDMEGGYYGPQLMRMLEQYEKEPTPVRLIAMRRRAAEYLESLHRNWNWNQVNLADFETWCAKRRAAMPDLASIASGRSTAPGGQGS